MFISEDGTKNYKIVYWGPGLCGKTTSIRYIYDNTPENNRSDFYFHATDIDRTLWFYTTEENNHFYLFANPSAVYIKGHRQAVFKGIDAIVFIADSQEERILANVEALEEMQEYLQFYNRELDEIPVVLCLNKRDLPNILPADEIIYKLELESVPTFETVASKGVGVFEAFEKIKELIITMDEPKEEINRLKSLSDKDLLTLLSDKQNSNSKKYVIKELDKRHQPNFIPHFIEALKDEDYLVRLKLLGALAKFEEKFAIGSLVKSLDDENISVRREAVKFLLNAQNENPPKAVINKLRDPNEQAYIKEQIIVRLSPTENENVLDSVIKGLDGEDESLKISVIEYLGKVKTETILDLFVKLANDRNVSSEIKGFIVNALPKFDNCDKIVETLIVLLEDKTLRSSVLYHLGELKDKKAVEPIISTVNFAGTSDNLSSAAIALGKIGDVRAIPVLQKLAKHKSEWVRKHAKDSLEKLNVNYVGLLDYLKRRFF